MAPPDALSQPDGREWIFLSDDGVNPAYPGQSVMENKWDIKEVEQEFRAQIEMALKNIPQLSHMTGHMLSTGFTKEVNELVLRLAKEYQPPFH